MSTQLYGFIIPRKKMFEVADIIREKFLQSELIQWDMKRLKDGDRYKVNTGMQVFEIGNGRVFFRLSAEYTTNDLTYPRIEEAEIGGREFHVDDRAQSMTAMERRFCERIDKMIRGQRYVIIPIFSEWIWRYYSAGTQKDPEE